MARRPAIRPVRRRRVDRLPAGRHRSRPRVRAFSVGRRCPPQPEEVAVELPHIPQIEPHPLVEVAIGVFALVVVILFHGVCVRIINRRFTRAWVGVRANPRPLRVNLVLAVVIGSLAATHLAETLFFAVPLTHYGIVPQFRDSYFFVLESYTTLGEGSIKLPDSWRLLGPIIAMSGLFTFGWTGSVLVSIMSQISHLDGEEARRVLRTAPTGQPPAT
jgi:hypothetical protein